MFLIYVGTESLEFWALSLKAEIFLVIALVADLHCLSFNSSVPSTESSTKCLIVSMRSTSNEMLDSEEPCNYRPRTLCLSLTYSCFEKSLSNKFTAELLNEQDFVLIQ